MIACCVVILVPYESSPLEHNVGEVGGLYVHRPRSVITRSHNSEARYEDTKVRPAGCSDDCGKIPGSIDCASTAVAVICKPGVSAILYII
jgi:hypothetical protein